MAACSDNILIMWDSLISVYRMWRFSLDSMLSPCWSVWTLGPPSRLSAVSAALSRPALCKHFSVMGVGPASSPWPLTPLQTPLPSEGPTKGSSTWRRLRTAALLHIVSDSGVLRLVVSLSFCRRVDSELKAWSCFSRRSLNHRLTSSETLITHLWPSVLLDWSVCIFLCFWLVWTKNLLQVQKSKCIKQRLISF